MTSHKEGGNVQALKEVKFSVLIKKKNKKIQGGS